MTPTRMGITLVASIALAQSEGITPKFDVASIKPSQTALTGADGSGRERVAFSPTGVTFGAARLSFCIQQAYNVKFYQVSGPSRLTEERYDIVAKTGQPSSKVQLMKMLQALLADRFNLRLHRETRSMPVYELVGPLKGMKLRRSVSERNRGVSVENGSFVFRHLTMSEFAEHLSDLSAFDRPVRDGTGLEGTFDIVLESAAREMLSDPASIFSAVEHIGFRLESRKRPLEILVVDRVERASEN